METPRIKDIFILVDVQGKGLCLVKTDKLTETEILAKIAQKGGGLELLEIKNDKQ